MIKYSKRHNTMKHDTSALSFRGSRPTDASSGHQFELTFDHGQHIADSGEHFPGAPVGLVAADTVCVADGLPETPTVTLAVDEEGPCINMLASKMR